MGETERREPLIEFDRRDWMILGGLLLLTIVALWPVLGAGVDRAPGLPDHDARTQWYPWRAYAADCIRAGQLPLWNPYVLCGTPFLANFQSAVFYPPNLLYCILSIALATKIIIVLHIWLSGVFAWLFGRLMGAGRWTALAGGIAFAFCGPQLLRVPAGHWGVSCAIPWLALAVFCAEWMIRRPGVWPFLLGVVAVALQVLSGVPQYVLIGAIAVAVFGVLRVALEWPGARGAAARLGGIAAFYAVGALLAGVQLLPAMEAASQGARSLPMRPEWAQQFSLGPECLLTLLAPGVFGGAGGTVYWGRYFYWEMNAYVGIVAFVLALFGLVAGKPRKLAWALGIAAGVMILLALGRHTPVMGLLNALLPFGDSLRGASKFLLPFALLTALLAALGLEALLRHKAEEWQRLQWIPFAMLAAFVLSLMLLPGLQKMVAGSGERFGGAHVTTTESMVLYFGRWVMAMALVALLLFVPRMRRAGERLALGVVIGAMALDVLVFSWIFTGSWCTFPVKGGAWPAGAGEALRKAGPEERTWAICGPELNDGMLERVATAEGIEPNPPVRFHLLFRTLTKQPVDIAPSIYQLDYGSLPDRVAVGRVLAPVKLGRLEPGQRLVAQGEKWYVVGSQSAVPRAALYRSVRSDAHDLPEALALVARSDPRREVVVEGCTKAQMSSGASTPEPVVFLRDDPEEVALKFSATSAGWLVLRDNDFPGWTAELDGRAVEIRPADVAFRAVWVETPGEHTVIFRYRSVMFQAGFACTVCAALVCVLVLVYARKRRSA